MEMELRTQACAIRDLVIQKLVSSLTDSEQISPINDAVKARCCVNIRMEVD